VNTSNRTISSSLNDLLTTISKYQFLEPVT
jgi:hypothetical protein